MFFSYNTAHSTGDNLSGRERAGLAFHVGQASLHDGGRAAPLSYPGPAGEGNDSAGQQDNEVIRILRGKAGAKGSAEVQEVPTATGGCPLTLLCSVSFALHYRRRAVS